MEENIYDLSEKFVYDYCRLRPFVGTRWGIFDYDDQWGRFDVNSYLEELKLLLNYKNKVFIIKKIYESKSHFNKWDKLAFHTIETTINNGELFIKNQEYLYDLNSIDSFFQNIISIFDSMKLDTYQDIQKIKTRLQTIDKPFDDYISVLKQGINEHKTVAKRQVTELIRQIEKSYNTFGESVIKKKPELQNFFNKRKIFEKLVNFLRVDYLPHSVQSDGIGRQRYELSIIRFVGNEIDIDETYMWGFSEINNLIKEIHNVCSQIDHKYVPKETNYIEIITRIKDTLKLNKLSDLVKFVQELENNAIKKLTPFFDIPDVMKKIEVKISPFKSLGVNYIAPSVDFSRSGQIWYMVEEPMGIYDEISTAYHEGFPGHHLQLSTQLYLKNKLSLLSRLTSFSSYCEGWALYAERLMDELNLYDKIEYKLGMLVNSLFRACRVVIDIGIHTNKKIPDNFFFHPNEEWSFDLAKEMLVKIAGRNDSYAKDEINRYFGWAGQAITYKIGERVFRRLRKLNNKLNFKEFHTLVLRYGSASLDYFEKDVSNHLVKKFKLLN